MHQPVPVQVRERVGQLQRDVEAFGDWEAAVALDLGTQSFRDIILRIETR